MRKRILRFVCYTLFCQAVTADNNLRFTDIRTLGLGNSEATESVSHNPALLALPSSKVVRLSYLNRYAVKELSTVSATLLYPNPVLPIAFEAASFGFDDYRESIFRLSLAKQLNKKWALGIGIHYSMVESMLSNEYPSRLSVDLGFTFQPSTNLLIGFSVMDYPSVFIGDGSTDINCYSGYSVRTGFRWDILQSLSLSANVRTSAEYPLTAGLGIEYTLLDAFRLRMGFQTISFTPTFGVGYHFLRFTMDVAVTYHTVLGYSTGLGLSYSF